MKRVSRREAIAAGTAAGTVVAGLSAINPTASELAAETAVDQPKRA